MINPKLPVLFGHFSAHKNSHLNGVFPPKNFAILPPIYHLIPSGLPFNLQSYKHCCPKVSGARGNVSWELIDEASFWTRIQLCLSMKLKAINIYPVVRNATLMVLITVLTLGLLNIEAKFFAQVVWIAAGTLCCFYFYIFILMKPSEKIRWWQRVALEVIAVAAMSILIFAGISRIFYKLHPEFIKVFPLDELVRHFIGLGIESNLVVLCATVFIAKSKLELNYTVSKMRWWDWIALLGGSGFLVWVSYQSAPKH